MKYERKLKKGIQVTGHYCGNDFRGTTTWSVANFNKMHEVECEEEFRELNVENITRYCEDMGMFDLKFGETGNRFGNKFKVTAKRMVPEICTFRYESEAWKYARSL